MSFLPLLFALLMWAVGTAAVVWLDSLPRATFRTSLTIAGLVAVAATVLVWFEASDAGPVAAYVGFAAAIVIWGWHEMSFLMGVVAGPSRAECPPNAVGWRRFTAATATVIHHELALAGTALLLFAISWGQPNQVAPLTFLLLFVLRLSAKFNLFFGVPNLSDEVFPEHLAYLKSYFRKSRINAFFPFSLLLGCGLVAWAWVFADAALDGSGAQVGAMLILGLAVLGVVEHMLLIMPLRDAKMWRWASHKSSNKASNNRAAQAAAIE